MNKRSKLLLASELFWLCLSLVSVFAVLSPILEAVPDYEFVYSNAAFIFLSIQFTRLIFLPQYSFLAKSQLWKIFLIFLSVPVIFFLISELNSFQAKLDEQGPINGLVNLSIYIRKEMLFFGTASIIAAILLPFAMVVSIWKFRNRR